MLDKDDLINSFMVFTINYFKNDYLVIKDFLFGESPWDKNFVLFLKISNEELIHLKTKMISTIFFKYVYDIIVPLGLDDKTESYCSADLYVNQEIQKIKYLLFKGDNLNTDCLSEELVKLLKNNNFIFKQIIKYNIELLNENNYQIKENTFNKFRDDIINIYEIYNKLYLDLGLQNMDDEQVQSYIEIFINKLDAEIKKYIVHSFRSQEEIEQFIKYAISIVYAFVLKNINENSEQYDKEEDLLSTIESGEDLVAIFLGTPDFSFYIVENIYHMYHENGEYYDFRKQLPNYEESFKSLDSNYDSEEMDYVIDTIFDDEKLDLVMESFEKDNFKINDVYEYLTNSSKSIYDRLFYFDLDARFEEYYKKELIRKIIANVYEYEIYLSKDYPLELNYNHYLEIRKLDLDNWDELYKYFVMHYDSLIERYYLYKHDTLYSKEKALIGAYSLKEVKIINKISKYSISRYIPICLKKVTQLKSVDYMNLCIHALVKNYEGYSYGERITMINSMCLNIYENILIGRVEGGFIDEFRIILERSDNPALILLNNPKMLNTVENIFLRLNGADVSYSRELRIRDRIGNNSSINVLKKLNPFNE